MQLKISGPHIAAIVTIGTIFGLLINSGDAGKMAHYRRLDYDALIAELAKSNSNGGPAGAAMVGIILVGMFVLLVDVVTAGYAKFWELYGAEVMKAMRPKK